MNYSAVDTFAVLLKRWLDAAVAHGDVVAHNFYTYKSIDPDTGQPPQLEVPYVAVDIPAGQPRSYHRTHANVLRQVILDRTRIAVQIGGRSQVALTTGSTGQMLGGFDTDVRPLLDTVEDFVERNPTLIGPSEVAGFVGQYVGLSFDQPQGQPFRVGPQAEGRNGHEGHLFWLILEHLAKTKEA
jgi:hypothetical protein